MSDVQLPGESSSAEPETLDDIATGLRRLRVTQGNVSFAEIASRISQQRQHDGVPAYRANVPKSTVHACFNLGRSRINPELVAEIVLALTSDPDQAAAWRWRCLHAQADVALTPTTKAHAETLTAPSMTAPHQDTADPGWTAPQRGAAERPSKPTSPAPNTGHPGATGPFTKLRHRLTPQAAVLVVLLGIVLNIVPHQLAVAALGDNFPLFFDMIGTAAVSLALGPWMGAATALATVIPWVFFAGSGYTAVVWGFAPIPIVGALLWGYGVHRFRLGQSLPRFIVLNLAVGVVCSLLAFAVITLMFGRATVHPIIQHSVDMAVAAGTPELLAILSANMFTSIVDKALAGVLALLVAGTMLRRFAPPALTALVFPHSANLFSAQRAALRFFQHLTKPFGRRSATQYAS